MVGWLVFVAGTAMRWWSTLYLASGEPGKMVTAGPYSICRNPLSLANLLLGISLVCFLGSLTFLMGFALAAIGYLSLAVPAEERRLHGLFGDAYDAYRRQVLGFGRCPGCSTRPNRFWSTSPRCTPN